MGERTGGEGKRGEGRENGREGKEGEGLEEDFRAFLQFQNATTPLDAVKSGSLPYICNEDCLGSVP